MTITNRLNLPDALVKACESGKHNSEGRISATTLLKGAKEIILTDRHWDEMTDDVADRIWAIFGTAVHSMLEHESPDTFAEEYLTVDLGEMKVTGRLDCYNMKTGTVEDYKTASCWKVVYQDFEDWKMQGLIYAWLLRKNGFKADHCRFTAMLKDWSKTKAKFDTEYPRSPVYVYTFDVTDKAIAAMESWIIEKVNEVIESKKLDDDDIAPCTSEERWATNDTYAIMKTGNKKASKVCDSLGVAESYVEANADKDKLSIVRREGQSKKCQEYCNAAPWCHFYKSLKEGDE